METARGVRSIWLHPWLWPAKSIFGHWFQAGFRNSAFIRLKLGRYRFLTAKPASGNSSLLSFSVRFYFPIWEDWCLDLRGRTARAESSGLLPSLKSAFCLTSMTANGVSILILESKNLLTNCMMVALWSINDLNENENVVPSDFCPSTEYCSTSNWTASNCTPSHLSESEAENTRAEWILISTLSLIFELRFSSINQPFVLWFETGFRETRYLPVSNSVRTDNTCKSLH